MTETRKSLDSKRIKVPCPECGHDANSHFYDSEHGYARSGCTELGCGCWWVEADVLNAALVEAKERITDLMESREWYRKQELTALRELAEARAEVERLREDRFVLDDKVERLLERCKSEADAAIDALWKVQAARNNIAAERQRIADFVQCEYCERADAPCQPPNLCRACEIADRIASGSFATGEVRDGE